VAQNSITSGNQQKCNVHDWDSGVARRAIQRLVVNRNRIRRETIFGVGRVGLEDGPARPNLCAFNGWRDSHDAAVAGTDETF
jgi:hypothetical protein